MLGDTLKQLRDSKKEKTGKCTQKDIASYLGISRVAYTQYELNNREPDYETLVKLAKYFDVSVDYLLGKKEPRQKDMPADLKKYLEQSEVIFDGDTYNLTPEEKDMVMQSLKVAFYAAKRANKRKIDDKTK